MECFQPDQPVKGYAWAGTADLDLAEGLYKGLSSVFRLPLNSIVGKDILPSVKGREMQSR